MVTDSDAGNKGLEFLMGLGDAAGNRWAGINLTSSRSSLPNLDIKDWQARYLIKENPLGAYNQAKTDETKTEVLISNEGKRKEWQAQIEYDKAIAHAALGEFENIMGSLRSAVELNPNFARAYDAMAFYMKREMHPVS